MKTTDFVKNYSDLPAKQQREALNSIIKLDKIGKVYSMMNENNRRVVTRILADADGRISGFVKENIIELLPLLESEDVKVRMHTAQVIGQNCAQECLDELIRALENEQTMYALPSYLLAIGNAKNIRAKQFLESYDLKSELDKHLFEEKTALQKALSNFVKKEKVLVRVLPTDIIAFSTPNQSITYNQCFNLSYKPRKFGKYIAVNQVSDFGSLYRMRAFKQALIYLGKCATADLPAFLSKREDAILQRVCAKNYRIEVRSVDHGVRIDIIQKCVAALPKMANTPSAYSFTLLIEIDGESANVFIDPMVDERFSYRKRSVPASIAPGVAACVCAYASEYFDPDARVLDNFCGSGTLLFERGYYPHHSLTGIDIDIKAIEAANINNTNAFAHPQFHHMDALKFTARKYDEIITNMPFGLRVSNHEKNKRLYREYFRLLPEIITPGGIAVLYTHEKQLLRDLINESGEFEMLKRTTFEAGGLYPSVFVLRKKASV